MTTVGILDIDMGNLRSVSKAVYGLGFDFELIRTPSQLERISHLIVPGVGSYRTAMAHVDDLNLRQPLRDYADTGRPLLGICLGMEILSQFGEEGGESRGLGFIPGRVEKMKPEGNLALPHVGWNTTQFRSKHPVLIGVRDGIDFYYVHSYHLCCCDPGDVLATADYGQEFHSVVGRNNVIGFQFHPEKSQANGLRLLENFCNWDGRC